MCYVLSDQDLDLVALKILEVARGGKTLITSDHLHVVLDYRRYGIRESGVLFHVVEAPRHGRLDVQVWNDLHDAIFTLLDLNTDKVHSTCT